MQMVEFTNTQGQKVYYNPVSIAKVITHTGTLDKSDIFVIGVTAAVTVVGAPEDIAGKISAAMKA